MIGPAIQALASHWRLHKIQLGTLLIGIALATALWSAVQAINAEARASYARASAQLAAGQNDELHMPGGFIPVDLYVTLRRAGWQVAAVLEGPYRTEDRTLRVMGVDVLAYPALPAFSEARDGATQPDLAELLTAPGRLFVRPELSAFLAGRPDLPPVIESDAVPPDLILTDIGVAEKMLGKPGQISRLVVLPVQPMGLPSLDALAPELERVAPSEAMDTAQLTDSFHLNLMAFGLLSFAVGLFIVHGTVGLAMAQRRGMFRTLRALGLPLNLLVRLVLLELTLIALLGGAMGLVLGYFLAGALLPDVAATLRGLYGAPVEGQLVLRPAWIASGLAMAAGGTLLASSQTLWHLSRMPLLAAPGLQAWRGRPGSARLTALCGFGLIAAGAATPLLGEGLFAGFAMLSGILVGAALLLPASLAFLLARFERRASGPVAQWVWADMRAQLPGLSLALMALLLALATNIGVGTMVASFRLTFIGWLDQRLTSELYVTARDDQQGAEIADWLRPRSESVLPIRRTELWHETGPLFLYGIIDDRTYRQNWPLIDAAPDVWVRVAAGNAVLVNEQLARRGSLWTGDRLTIAPDWTLEIAGVYSDYGNPTGQALVSMQQFDTHFPEAPNRRFGIRVVPEKATELAQALREQFDMPPQAVIHQAAIKAQSLAVFEKTFVVTSALNILTLGVSGFAILTSLLTLWTQRLPQIAPVWALGLTRTRLARLELLRSVLLAALTAIFALPLGLILAWVLLSIINVEAFGWRLPMHLFPLDWLRLLGLTLLAAAAAAALPAMRLRRLPPSDLLRVFANER
ncbi:ABC transporter permease [Ruegeria sediminis]|uniref:ABC transporter permease n=1 Tax=Ruegeria sediminis TaxID=2583820 RepID=A0ABY2WZT3_9RHOB|nr:FtsX-like permease family protein [Ruegeria sediminis]TMV08496.1 ABC transporter permease [Ruegeria sediminis]